MKTLSKFLKQELTDYKILLRNIPSPTILFFTLSVVCANLMANKELINFKYLALDCGFAFSWIMFLCMDIICKRYGAKASVKISIFALGINLFVCASFFLLSKIPGNWGEFYTHQNEVINVSLNKTFGGSWYIVLGSATASLISSIVNALINKTVGTFVEKKLQKDNFTTFAIRSYVSTFVAQFADNFIFATMVSKLFFGWTWTQVLLCSIVAATFELFCEVIFSKLGYRILCKWENDQVGKEYFEYKNLSKEIS